MSTVRRWLLSFLRSTSGRALVVLLVLYGGYQVWIGVQASNKVDAAVYRQVDEEGFLAVKVRMGFPPERFHILEVQKFGRIRRVEGNSVEVHSVLPEGVGSLARRYWITSIEPLGPGNPDGS
jgi:hypothetical protein